MGVTATYSLPYPEPTDAPDGPTQIEALADAVEDEIERVDAAIAGLSAVVQLRRSSSQTLTHDTPTPISWNVSDIDTNGFHSTSVNPSRVTPTISGLYLCIVVGHFAANATGDRRVYFTLNGGLLPPVGRAINLSNAASTATTSRIVQCNGTTDYIEGNAYQSSGGDLAFVGNADGTNTFQSLMSVHRIAPLP